MDMTATIERLSSEKTENARKKAEAEEARKKKEDEDFKAGQLAGRHWAYDEASYEELSKYLLNYTMTDEAAHKEIQEKHGPSLHWARGWLESVREFLGLDDRLTRLFK